MPYTAAFYQGLHFLLRLKQSSSIEVHDFIEILTIDHLKYKLENTMLIVSICMGKSG